MQRSQSKSGFTIIELIVAVGIILVAGTIFLALLTWGLRLSRESQAATTLQVETSDALDQMTRDIRGASDVITATDSTLTIDVYPRYASASPDRIGYTVVGTRLEREVIPPTGYPPVYILGDEVIRGLTNHVATDTGIFRYFDEDGIELSNPPPLGAVSMIEVTLTLQDTSARNPQPLTSTTKVHLRNRKTNL